MTDEEYDSFFLGVACALQMLPASAQLVEVNTVERIGPISRGQKFVDEQIQEFHESPQTEQDIADLFCMLAAWAEVDADAPTNFVGVVTAGLLVPCSASSKVGRCRGVAQRKLGHLIVTTAGLDEVKAKDDGDYLAILHTTAVHETGHLLGLVSATAARAASGGHCSERCIMRDGSSAFRDIVKDAFLWVDEPGKDYFCPECQTDALKWYEEVSARGHKV